MNRWLIRLLMVFLIGHHFALTARADDFSVKLQSLQPVSGYIVDHMAGQVVMDIDASNGLQVGDLLSANLVGKSFVHPATGKVVGQMEVTESLLVVTRIKHGYSLARPLKGYELPDIGEPVQSFSGVSAVLISGGENAEFYRRLRKALPALDWQGIFPELSALPQAESIQLRFQQVGNNLRVGNRQGQVLREVALTSSPEKPAQTAVQPAGSAAAAGLRVVAKVDERVLQGATVQTNAGLLLSTVDGQRVRVYNVASGMKQPTAFMPAEAGKPLAVSWWRPTGTNEPLLLVTSIQETMRDFGQITETRVNGEIYDLSGAKPLLVAGGLPYFLGGFDRDGDGQPELLLGQQFSPDNPFGPVFRLTLQDHEISRSGPGFELPAAFTVTGSTMADLNGDGLAEIIQVRNGALTVFQGRETIYRTAKQMGGSLAAFSFASNPDQVDQLISTATLEIPPLVADLDGDGQPEILAVGADRGSFRVPGIGSSVNASWIDLIHMGLAGFEKSRLTDPRENPVQAMWLQGGQLWLIESLTTSSLSAQGHSRLLNMPLPKTP